MKKQKLKPTMFLHILLGFSLIVVFMFCLHLFAEHDVPESLSLPALAFIVIFWIGMEIGILPFLIEWIIRKKMESSAWEPHPLFWNKVNDE
jgi:hypothetical protein